MKKFILLLMCCGFSYFSNAQPICDGVNIVQTANISTDDLIAAEETLIANNQITGTANVTYQAIDYVLLKGGMFVTSSASLIAKTADCMSIGTNEQTISGFDLTVYNNPTTGDLSISYQIDQPLNLELLLLDILGRPLKILQPMQKISVGEFSLDININDLSRGTYLLQFRTDIGQITTSKLVKI